VQSIAFIRFPAHIDRWHIDLACLGYGWQGATLHSTVEDDVKEAKNFPGPLWLIKQRQYPFAYCQAGSMSYLANTFNGEKT